MATVTKSIGTSSRDYSTITLWEADLDDGGIYSASDDAVGEMYNDSTFSEQWTIDGGATIGLNSITLTVAESERHDGTAGTGVRFIQSASWKCQVTTTVPTHLSWFEMDGNSTVNNNTMLSHGRDGTINHLILHNHTSFWNSTVLNASGHNLDTTLSNCIVYDFVNSAPSGKSVVIVNQGVASGAGNITGANLTIHGCYSTGGSPTKAYALANTANRTGQNILVTDCDICFNFSSYPNATVSHNATSDSTASGTGSLTNIVAADQYVSTVLGSEDLHLKSGSDCIDAGIDLGTTNGVELDIDGYDRDSNGVTWDIGADEYVSLAVDVDSDGVINISSLSSLDIDAQINKSFLLTINSDKELNSEILQTINIDNQLNFSTTLLVVNDSVLNSLNSLELNIDCIIPIFWNGVNAQPEKYWILSTRDSDWQLKLRDKYWYVNISDKTWNINLR